MGNGLFLLDEAHRGDSDDSNFKKIYQNFARDGFIFNFSATFTEPIDLKTCAYNFNLEKFIQEGYGKKIYVSERNVKGFNEKDVFSGIEKQRIVLKTLILQTYISHHYKKLSKSSNQFYHKPLLLTITNTVQEGAKFKKSDLKFIFFQK